MQKIPAAQFKAQCLAVMDRVSQSGQPVIITKHGKPVVKLVRVEINGLWEIAWLAENGRIESTIASNRSSGSVFPK